MSALNESLQLSYNKQRANVYSAVCNVQSRFPPVQIVLLLIASNMMELTIDETLPQPLLPWVGGQVVEAKHVAPILACIFDNQGQSN